MTDQIAAATEKMGNRAKLQDSIRYITLFHLLNGSIKIYKKSTLINTAQQQKEKEKKTRT